MQKLLISSLLLILYFAYGVFLSQYRLPIIEEVLEPQNPLGFYDYRGVTNVHTDRNLGSGTHAEVIRAAQEAHLDFLIFTDLNDFKRDEAVEGYHRQLLVLMGAEYSYLDSRILSYDLVNRAAVDSLGQAQLFLADRLSQIGKELNDDLLILAHPFKAGYAWSGSYPSGLDGIEVINLKAVWQKAWATSKLSFIWSAFIYPFNAHLAFLRLYQEPEQEIELWDTLNNTRPTFGFAGTEATAKTGSIGSFSLRFPSYQTLFGFLTNHILVRSELTGEQESDRRKVWEALRNGQFYMSLDLLGNPKGFVTYIAQDEQIWPLGSKLRWKKRSRLIVRLPQKPRVPFEVVILRDGERVLSSNSVETEYEILEPGAYRVLVRVIPTLPLPDGKHWISWIYTNPFRVL